MLNRFKSANLFGFESFGVKISISCNDSALFNKIIHRLTEVIPHPYFSKYEFETDHHYFIQTDGKKIRLFTDNEDFGEGESEENLRNFFFGRLRLTIAEFAVGKVFLHAGAVCWKKKAIIIPGRSFSGKTRLVAELLKQGATYYSDEYAILDENGLNYPYPKTLSMRGIIDDYRQVELSPKSFGRKIGSKPVPVGMILFSKFEQGAEWNPKILSPGNGMLEILEHTIPIRFNPKFSLRVLNNISNRAIIVKSKRGEAQEVVNLLLKFFETEAI